MEYPIETGVSRLSSRRPGVRLNGALEYQTAATITRSILRSICRSCRQAFMMPEKSARDRGMSIPKISAIIPAHNGAAFIGEAIQSIRNQTFRVSEIIVVDDGSTDDTAAIVLKMGEVRLIRQEQRGQAAARNRGFAESTGDVVAFLDADDLWTPAKLAGQLTLLDSGTDCVFGLAVQFKGSPPTDLAIASSAKHDAHLPGAMLIHRRHLDLVGLYDTRWRAGEVIDWYARAVDTGLRIATLQQVVLLRRLHDNNLGRRIGDVSRDYIDVVRTSLQRRRRDKAD